MTNCASRFPKSGAGLRRYLHSCFFIHIRQFHPLFATYPSQIYHNTSSISNGMCSIRSFKIGVPVYLVLMVSEDGYIGTCSISPSPLLSHFWAPSPNLPRNNFQGGERSTFFVSTLFLNESFWMILDDFYWIFVNQWKKVVPTGRICF